MSEPDFVDLCHRRNVLAAVVIAQVPEHTLETVDLNFRKGRFAPWDTQLEVVRAPELLGSDLEAVKAYVHRQFTLNPNSHIIPCFYLVVDDRTTTDGSTLFVQQNWVTGPNETMRVMPQHAYTLFNGLLLFEEEFERCREEDLDDDDVYDPSYIDFNNRPGLQSVVRFSTAHARQVSEDGDTQTYVLEATQAQELGLNPVGRTLTLQRGADGTFSDRISLTVYTSDVQATSDHVQVWGPSDYFVWGQD